MVATSLQDKNRNNTAVTSYTAYKAQVRREVHIFTFNDMKLQYSAPNHALYF
jgi:hypothetical protein